MPLKPSQIIQQLTSKSADFKSFDANTLRILQQYRSALKSAMGQTSAQIEAALAGHKTPPGALPLEPLDGKTSWVRACGLSWSNREDSLAWVRQQLEGISTFAVDGSQIYPGKDLSVPVALVQIGWYENLHVAGGQGKGEYIKDIATTVMTPTELRSERGDLAERKVNLKRFQMEVERTIEYLKEHRGSETALAFFDGSLVASFADAFDPATRDAYVSKVGQMLEASAHYQVPVVGYIDTSSARDLTEMLQALYGLPEAPGIHDAQLLRHLGGQELAWGDRLPLFLCRRSGILAHYKASAGDIAFTYLRTNRDSDPVRLELPAWVVNAGIADRVLDWVRGEVVIGSGYPYVIETADQVAVVTSADRQAFFRILQKWADAEPLKLQFSRKMVSKARRR
jgi:NurA domain